VVGEGRAPPIHNLGLAPILRGIIKAADSSSITLHFTSKLQRQIFSFPSTDRSQILQKDWQRGDEKKFHVKHFYVQRTTVVVKKYVSIVGANKNRQKYENMLRISSSKENFFGFFFPFKKALLRGGSFFAP
jgi:hypothetical protein